MNLYNHLFLAVFSVFLTASVHAGEMENGSGHDVGNPGDPVRLQVSEARKDAAVYILRITRANAGAADQGVVDWIFANQNQYAAVTLTSEHVWLDDDRPYCALAFASDSRIEFSYPRCSHSIGSRKDAVLLMLHESVHLMGVASESFADAVALAVWNMWINSGASRTPRWDPVNSGELVPEERANFSAVFTGLNADAALDRRFIVWGGCRQEVDSSFECGRFHKDGGIYNPSDGLWKKLPQLPNTIGAPHHQRAYASAVWTGDQTDSAVGNKMLIFGGCSGSQQKCDQSLNSLLIYNGKNNSWSMLTANDAPEARVKHAAVWTGNQEGDGSPVRNKMIVWGGVRDYAVAGRGEPLNSGGVYDLASDSWTSMSRDGAPAARRYFSALWTGKHPNPKVSNKLIVFGGCDREVGRYCPEYYGDGGIYDPVHDTWKSIPAAPFLRPRARHTAVWTGDRMIVYGGQHKHLTLNDGAVFNPADMSWTPLPPLLGVGRYGHSAVWSGEAMIIFGGQTGINKFAEGVMEWHPEGSPTGMWKAVPTTDAPVGRAHHFAWWTGSNMLIWGGESEDRHFLSSGAMFSPER